MKKPTLLLILVVACVAALLDATLIHAQAPIIVGSKPEAYPTFTVTPTLTSGHTLATTPTPTAHQTYLPLIIHEPRPPVTPTPTPTPTPSPTPLASWSAYELRVVALTNQIRANNGCSVMLAMNDKLHQAASSHSVDMIARDFFSHTNPDGQGPSERLAEVGYNWSTWGENITAGYSSPEAVVAGWMNSSGHRANILNCNYTEIGVGYAYAANDPGTVQYHHYWTQVLARPR